MRLFFVLQVRKELEMGGIEFYPQKEFDEDMEDKSDNDKIRVRRPWRAWRGHVTRPCDTTM